MRRDTRAGEAAGANMATREASCATSLSEEGGARPGSAAGGGAIAGAAIANMDGLRGVSPSTACRFVAAPGAGAGATWDARTARAACCLERAGANTARGGAASGAMGAEEGGAKAGSATGGCATAGISSGTGASPSLTVPVGEDATADLSRTARAGRRRAELPAGSLSDCSLVSRGQGMSPKWPAAANTAPPASSRPKAASAVDQRNPAAARWLVATAACSRCLILSRSPALSSSSGSAARMKDASGPRCRSVAESVVLLPVLMEYCPRPTGH